MCQDNTGTLIWRLIRKKRTGCAKGRFAKQCAAGIGGSSTTATNRYPLPVDVYHEPATAGILERRMVEWNQMDHNLHGFVTMDRPSPPPSDYFLGFKSPGTAVLESFASSWFGNITRLCFRSGAGDDQSEMSAGVTPPFRGSSAVANENVRRVPLCTLSGRTHGRLVLSQRLLSIIGAPSLTLSLIHI